MKILNIRFAILSCALLLGSAIAGGVVSANDPTCPAEVKSGEAFPLKAHGVTQHASNSVNFNIDHKALCSWKMVTPSKNKEGHVCTYAEFSECSVEGTPPGTVFYLTSYKPKVKAAHKEHQN